MEIRKFPNFFLMETRQSQLFFWLDGMTSMNAAPSLQVPPQKEGTAAPTPPSQYSQCLPVLTLVLADGQSQESAEAQPGEGTEENPHGQEEPQAL